MAMPVTKTKEREIAKPEMLVAKEEVVLSGLEGNLPLTAEVAKLVARLKISPAFSENGDMRLPREVRTQEGAYDVARVIGNITSYLDKNRDIVGARHRAITGALQPIDVNSVLLRGRLFADHLEAKRESLVKVMTGYETHEVANDEVDRCIDLFSNLHENQQYFSHKINAAASFLPRNQPLYALACFGLVPSLMASQIDVRPPVAMHFFFKKLEKELNLQQFFPNVTLNLGEREAFVAHCARQFLNPKTGQMEPVVDAVIFTGTMENADKLREQIDPRTLLIANGAGHNPVVVAPGADLAAAVHSVVRVQLYNQGQDCANPSAILVHRECMKEFLELLRAEVGKVKVGPYSDPEVRVGPITERSDMPRILNLLSANSQWLDASTPGVIRVKEAVIEPTIIVKPLKCGANFVEQFSPVFFVQEYEKDSELNAFFDTPQYRRNAMYVSVFGTSAYVDALPSQKQHDGRPVHDESTIIRNKDLHAPGVERGTQPYGGFGRGASCYSLNNVVTSLPTLPQRDIYEQIVVPRLRGIN